MRNKKKYLVKIWNHLKIVGSEKKLRRLLIFCESQLCNSCNFALCMLCIIFSKLAKDFKELNLVLEGWEAYCLTGQRFLKIPLDKLWIFWRGGFQFLLFNGNKWLYCPSIFFQGCTRSGWELWDSPFKVS